MTVICLTLHRWTLILKKNKRRITRGEWVWLSNRRACNYNTNNNNNNDDDNDDDNDDNDNRVVYREDLVKLKEQLQAKQKAAAAEEEDDGQKKAPKKRKGIKSTGGQGMKDEPPKNSLSLEFVHG